MLLGHFSSANIFVSTVLPSKKLICASAVSEVINSVVIHERIITGPAAVAPYHQFYHEYAHMNSLIKLITPGDTILSPKHVFSLLNLARKASLDLLSEDSTVIPVLDNVTGRSLDCALIRRFIATMSVNASYHSPHYWERLFSKGESDYYYSDLSAGVLGANTIAMNAVDGANANRGWYGSEYFSYTAKRSGVTFPPEQTIHEFYAGSLLFRTLFYLLFGELTGCMYRGDSIRAAIVKAILEANRDQRKSFSSIVLEALTDEERRQDDIVNNILGYQSFVVDVPLVAQAVLQQAQDLADVVKITLQVRESKEAKEFRKFCLTVDEAIAKGTRSEVEEALRELSRFGLDLATAVQPDQPRSAQGRQELISFGSPLLSLVPWSARRVATVWRKLRFRHLAFLDELRTVSRSMGVLEKVFQ
jgi:hypothetical protein